MVNRVAWLLALMLLLGACGESDPSAQTTATSPPRSSTVVESTTSTVLATTTTAPQVSSSPPVTEATTTLAVQNEDCVPTVPGVVDPPGDPNRIFEDIIFYLTGERQTTDLDPVEETIDDPNYGGVWGDFAGGVVVAVLDCSLVDANKLAEMAGGSDSLHLIEVPYTFQQVNAFRDALAQELRDLGMQGSVPIDSTLTGRFITVTVVATSAGNTNTPVPVPEHALAASPHAMMIVAALARVPNGHPRLRRAPDI